MNRIDGIIKLARLEESTIYDFYALTLLPKDMYERDESYSNKLKYSVLNSLKRQLKEEWIVFSDEIESTSFINDWEELFNNSIGEYRKTNLTENETHKVYNEYVKNFDEYKDINPGQYFGKKWAILWVNYIKILNIEDWDQFVKQFDYFIDLSHNTGAIFDKFEVKVKSAIDNKKYFTPYELLNSCSENVKKFVSKILNIKDQLFDFGDGKGPVPAHRHYFRGTMGGWVANTAKVENTCYIEKDALVYDNAKVSGNVNIYGNAQVFDNAKIIGEAVIYDKAKIYGNASIEGYAKVSGQAQVFDNAIVYSRARVWENAKVYGSAKVRGKAEISGNAKVHGYSQVFNDALVSENAEVCDKADVYRAANVYGTAYIGGNALVDYTVNEGKILE